MSEMKEMILEVVEKIFKDHVHKETVDLVEHGDWAKEVWQLLTNSELLNVAIPEAAGGAGGDLDDLLNIYRIIGQFAVPIPFVETTLANYFLDSFKLLTTNNTLSYCLPQDTLQINDDDTITGYLVNVAWARHVKELVAFAYSSKGIQPVHIALDTAELSYGKNIAGEPRETVSFNKVKILQKSQQVLNDEQIQFINTLDTATKIALMCGAIEKIFALTVQYSKERQQFGRPIHRFQLVQQHIAVLAGEQAIASSSFENMVSSLLEGSEQLDVAFTRVRLDEASKLVSSSAHQVHAAIGVTHEHRLHQYTRRLWAWRDEGLTARYWNKVIANTLLSAKNEDLWSFLTDSKKILSTK